MALNLAVGTFIISLTVVIHVYGLVGITWFVSRVTERFRSGGHRSQTLAMVTVAAGLFMVTTAEVWLWAACFRVLGVFGDFDTALYFSTVSYSTLGYGDVVPPAQWRLLCALEGINGFLLIGWSTAYLIAAGTRIGPFRTGEHF